MKKLSLALAASAVALTGATQASLNSGFYLGATGGYGSFAAKYSANTPAPGIPGSADIGANAGNIGVIGGYGWVNRCFYLGGEIGYTFENLKANYTFGSPNGVSTLKRNGYFNFAARGGYLFTPSTMLYIRLGGNIGKWTLTDNRSNGVFAGGSASGSRSRVSFVPGVGLETAVHKNIYVRVEYAYEFGQSVTATNAGAFPNRSVTASSIRPQSTKLGIAYKF